METATFLNIKSKARSGTDVITGQTLAMVSSDKNKNDGFKSAFKNQMDNKRDDVHPDKDLPQNGNELPRKKITIIIIFCLMIIIIFANRYFFPGQFIAVLWQVFI